jgi:DNA-binding response OmpR family regulator
MPDAHSDTTVLLVEDDGPLRELLGRLLVRRGHTVLRARNGAEAIDVATRHDGPIALLLTDVVMPKLNGFELWERLRAVRSETRVLYVTGRAEELVGVRGGLKESHEAYLLKPFTRAALEERIQSVLDG